MQLVSDPGASARSKYSNQKNMDNSLVSQCDLVISQPLIWGDMDAYEHVNNTVYFRFFEDIRMAYFARVGVDQYKAAHGKGPILARTECSFRLPLAYPGTVQIGTSVSVLSEKKLNMDYYVYSEEHGALAAEGSGLIVFYDYNANKSCAIPDEIVGRINATGPV